SEPPVDVSAGRWRDHAQITPRPPCFAQQERRKFLVCGGNGPLLLKFIGLGRYGRRKRELARARSEASFTPRLRGERYGFLAVEWRADAAPWRPSREALIVHLAGYLGFRAKHFAGGEGASLARLASMARENATLALGEEAGRMLERRCELEQLAREAAPMAVDGRLHNWEWIADCSGAPLKTDAVDHHAGHDLVGCQDIAWDVAGAEA